MRGIYLFTNNINGKHYVGQSVQLEERYKQHKRNYNKESDSEYNYSFHRALRKYGFENFSYKILTSNNSYTKDNLDELEIKYVDEYKAYKEGYNETPGGSKRGGHVLTEAQVIDIKNKLYNKVRVNKIVEEYKISASLVSMINQGRVWVDIGDYSYPIANLQQTSNQGEKNSHALSTDEEILNIRKQFVTKSLPEIYKDYKDKYSFSGLKKICYGVTNKHLPVYKKRDEKWYLNGTCIDYPSEGEY